MTQSTATVASSDGVSLALHHLSPTDAGSLPILLLSHATGFHGRCWLPVAQHLLGAFDCWALDYRGYGDSPAPDDWQVCWGAYGDDALSVVEYLTTHVRQGPIWSAGHSMGGATLLMAALKKPELFAGIVAFEPIVFPKTGFRPADMPPNPLAAATRKRRATFPSLEDAITNFSSKPPMDSFDPDALNAYVHYGFNTNADGTVTLKCHPEHEARTYDTGGIHETWDSLSKVATPVWILGSSEQPMQPSAIAPRIAEQIPGAHYELWTEVSHFGPLEDTQRFADFLRRVACK